MVNFNKISVKAIHVYTIHQIIITKLMDGCLTPHCKSVMVDYIAVT